MDSYDIFQPVAVSPPLAMFGNTPHHPAPRLGIVRELNTPIGTNKFYANFFLGSQTAATWTHPYSVAWSRGGGGSGSWGLSIQHIDEDQRDYGPPQNPTTVRYFINPIGIQSLVLSAAELGPSTAISTSFIAAFSVNINLYPSQGGIPAITFPLVQGMGFVTAIYYGSRPILQTGVFFRSIHKPRSLLKSGVMKYLIKLEDGKVWLLYAYSYVGNDLDLTLMNNRLIQSSCGFNGIIQICKLPVGSPEGGKAEQIYDMFCGAYPTTVMLSGKSERSTGSYTLSFRKGGIPGTKLIMFALPHHVESFSPVTRTALTDLQLNTTTKGVATAVVADSWTLVENLPTRMGFAPWNHSFEPRHPFSGSVAFKIHHAATMEASQDMTRETNQDSIYFSGKALAKFAGVVYVMYDLLNDVAAGQVALTRLQTAFAVFAMNKQRFPLLYESAWGGLVSSATYTTGDPGADFGNTYYNDHHFHYGYFIYAAAIIGYLDPTWIPANKDFVNTLVRDIANPSTLDPYFPVSRNFDWYHGHSWAHGLYESWDGKNQESSSEDAMSAYALKMWGSVVEDRNMEARGNLQLAITARSLQKYYLYDGENTTQPSRFIGNKVAGILFENKIDYTTFFGSDMEFIHGIHMLPLLPSTTLTRPRKFVTEEWDTYFSNGRVDSIKGGWRGVLYGSLATIDPRAAWKFFSQPQFDRTLLDGGASLTWYLAFAAMLGGAPNT